MQILLKILMASLLCVALSARAQPEGTPAIETMLRLARAAQLAQRAEWLKINLYHQTWFGLESRVDDPSFFLAPNGQRDAQAELEATIRAAYDEGMADNSRQPRLCRWVARYQYLHRAMQELGFDYPAPRCDGYQRWKATLARDHVSLVFASIYLNSPASMYGHTFLRFDSDKAGEFNRLNDTTVGYTVNSGGDFGPLFLVRSLTGSFPGNFVSVPYFMKIREYADLENRDLWEYQTDFTPDEIDRMHAFIWQHSFSYMNYYFFDDNCALMLLATLEAGRPSLRLIEDAKPWFIPLDGVKSIQQAGIVVRKHYRPSQYSTLAANFQQASPTVQAAAVRLARSRDVTQVPFVQDAATQAEVLDLALGVLEYQRNQADTAEAAEPYNRFQLALSGVRSRNETPSRYHPAPTPAESPDQGHDSFRVGLMGGHVGSHDYAQINLRGGYHDSLDPHSGFVPGASSKIGDLYLRLQRRRIAFERLDLFDVFLPSERMPWYRPLTVKANVAVRREVQGDGTLSNGGLRIELGGGEGYRLSEHSQIYLLADSVTRFSAADSSLAAGPLAGWVWQPQGKWRAESSVASYWQAAGKRSGSWLHRVSAGVAWDTADNQNNLRLTVTRQWTGNGGDPLADFSDVQLGVFHYF
ncbi:MAG: DUF4105 domain-containing protein [Sideroxydans sp.]